MSFQVKPSKGYIFSFVAFLAAVFLLSGSSDLLSQPTTGTALAGSFTTQTGNAPYFRLVRLAHGAHNGTIVASESSMGNGITGNIWQSTNNGGSWTQVATVPVISGSSLVGAATLFEMPQTVGSLTAGTLLYAATYTQGTQRAIEIYTSSNAGSTWSYWATPKIGGTLTQGLWEPQFEVALDGALVMFWSDETDSCCSQKLVQMRTYNGTSWQNQQNTVASTVYGDRPGMAVVTRLPSGTYFMTYEICGGANCTVFYRTSTDGWNFGSPQNTGTKIQTPSGQYFEHAPTNAWSPSVLSTNGAILVIGQLFVNASNNIDPQNGTVILENFSSDGNSGIWIPITAPVQIPNAYDNYCPNYSSSLLPATDGSSILELTSAYNSSGVCGGYYATETFNNLPADGTTHAFRNLGSGNLCIDDAGWGTTDNTVADLWTCSGLAVQEWTVHSKGSGWFSLSNAFSGLCMDNTGGSQSPRTPTTLWGCANNSNQNWQFMDRGNAVYMLMNQSSGTLFLDDWMASQSPGVQLEVNNGNGSPAQNYIVQDGTPTGPPGYTYCAAESGTCSFSGQQNVAFGVNGAFGFKAFTNSTPCTVAAFGNSDPAPGFVKACFYQTSAAPPPGYTYCAAEGGTCNFTGQKNVANGANKSFGYQAFTGSTPCTTAAFGGTDPAPGVLKACFYQTAAVGPPGFTYCAAEGGTCTFSGTATVAYGENGMAYNNATFTNSAPCTTAAFGGTDPDPSVVKSCFYQY